MSDLWAIVPPVLVSVLISVPGALLVARFAGPAQASYVDALKGRLSVVTQERDEATAQIPRLEARIDALETEVAELQRQNNAKDREIADLYRKLGARASDRG